MKMFGLWKWNTNRNKLIEKANNKKIKELRKSKDKHLWNIYGWKTVGQAFTGESIVHGIFKYRLFVPLLILADRILKKVIIKDKKDFTKEWYDEDIVLFDELFEKSIHDWVYTFIYASRGYKNLKKVIPTKKYLKGQISDKPSCKMLRVMKKLVLTMVKYDTAYREFFTVLIHNISIGFNKKYNGQVVRHLIYDESYVYDIDYYYLGRVLKKQGVIKDVKYSYNINGDMKVQHVADEIIIDNFLTSIKPKKLRVPKFDRKKYDKLVEGGNNDENK